MLHTESRHEYSLDDEWFGVKGERSQQETRYGMMLGFGFQHQTFIAGEFSVLHLLNLPFTYTQKTCHILSIISRSVPAPPANHFTANVLKF